MIGFRVVMAIWNEIQAQVCIRHARGPNSDDLDLMTLADWNGH